jgi:hypothetical protein
VRYQERLEAFYEVASLAHVCNIRWIRIGFTRDWTGLDWEDSYWGTGDLSTIHACIHLTYPLIHPSIIDQSLHFSLALAPFLGGSTLRHRWREGLS